MAQQTAVEWLIEEINKNTNWIPVHIQEQAKQREKEQIIQAWMATDNELQRIAAEQYYKETYGK